MSDIAGNYVFCGKCIGENDDAKRVYVGTYIRIDQIKSIETIIDVDDQCLIYTYKDQWYVVNMNAKDLLEEINDYLKGSKSTNKANDKPFDYSVDEWHG